MLHCFINFVVSFHLNHYESQPLNRDSKSAGSQRKSVKPPVPEGNVSQLSMEFMLLALA